MMNRDLVIYPIHGYSGNADSMANILTTLEEWGGVLRHDLPGHGTSPEDLVGYSYEDFVNFSLDRRSEIADDKKVVLIGHSVGCNIATDVAKRSDAAALILISPSIGMKRLYANPFTRLLARTGVLINLNNENSGTTSYNKLPAKYAKVYDDSLVAWEGIENLRVPTLLITFERDRVFNPSIQSDLVDRFPNIKHLTLPTNKPVHTFFDGAKLEVIVEYITEFLGNLDTSSKNLSKK